MIIRQVNLERLSVNFYNSKFFNPITKRNTCLSVTVVVQLYNSDTKNAAAVLLLAGLKEK